MNRSQILFTKFLGSSFWNISTSLDKIVILFLVTVVVNFDKAEHNYDKCVTVIELLPGFFLFYSMVMDFVFEISSDALFLLIVVIFI